MAMTRRMGHAWRSLALCLLAAPCMQAQAACAEPRRETVNGSVAFFAVPDVAGLAEAEAVMCLKRYYFSTTPGGVEASALPAGQVVRTDPVADTLIPAREAPVTYWLASGSNIVPDVATLEQEEALRKITAAGFAGETREQPGEDPPGHVSAQEPKAGSEASLGASVLVYVAAPLPRVPIIAGLDEADALKRLAEAGLEGRRTGSAPSNQAAGIVMTSIPEGGSVARPGAEVRYAITSGQNFVPDLRGHPLGEVEKLLADAGFRAGVPRVDVAGASNVVEGQQPEGGVLAPLETLVTVMVKSAVPATETRPQDPGGGTTEAQTDGGVAADMKPNADPDDTESPPTQPSGTVRPVDRVPPGVARTWPLRSAAAALAVVALLGLWWSLLKPWPLHWPPTVALHGRLDGFGDDESLALAASASPATRIDSRLDVGEARFGAVAVTHLEESDA